MWVKRSIEILLVVFFRVPNAHNFSDYNSGIVGFRPSTQPTTNIIADIVKALLDNEDRNYEAFTPIMMELPEVSGVEPDYCFYIDNWQAVVGKDRIDWKVDLPPDLAIEIDVTSFTSELDFLPFNVPEVWIFKKYQLTIYQLVTDKYEVSETSRYFPGILLQQTIDDCFVIAKEKGTGAVISQLRRFLNN